MIGNKEMSKWMGGGGGGGHASNMYTSLKRQQEI